MIPNVIDVKQGDTEIIKIMYGDVVVYQKPHGGSSAVLGTAVIGTMTLGSST